MWPSRCRKRPRTNQEIESVAMKQGCRISPDGDEEKIRGCGKSHWKSRRDG